MVQCYINIAMAVEIWINKLREKDGRFNRTTTRPLLSHYLINSDRRWVVKIIQLIIDVQSNGNVCQDLSIRQNQRNKT